MNALRMALADYFAVRRALGFKLYRAEKLLGQFLTFVEGRGEDHLTTATALAWATLPQGGQTWAFARLSVVRRFANHLRGIDPATEVPPTHLLVQQKGRATPYLYSESDIAALIAAAGMLRTPHRVATFRTLIALLAVTGMRVGEAIGLDRDDFDPVIGLLTIRNAKFGKSRELPLHPSTVAALVDYLRRDDRPTNSSNTPALLVTTVGTRFHYTKPIFQHRNSRDRNYHFERPCGRLFRLHGVLRFVKRRHRHTPTSRTGACIRPMSTFTGGRSTRLTLNLGCAMNL
jgi:integrase